MADSGESSSSKRTEQAGGVHRQAKTESSQGSNVVTELAEAAKQPQRRCSISKKAKSRTVYREWAKRCEPARIAFSSLRAALCPDTSNRREPNRKLLA